MNNLKTQDDIMKIASFAYSYLLKANNEQMKQRALHTVLHDKIYAAKYKLVIR